MRLDGGGFAGLTARGVTRLDGTWGKKQVWRPHVRTWGLSEGNALYWGKHLWHCCHFLAIPAAIQRPHSDSAPRESIPLAISRYAPAYSWADLLLFCYILWQRSYDGTELVTTLNT